MSKGSPIVVVRVPQDLLTVLDSEIEVVNRSKAALKYDRSLFILTAVCEKLAHLERGRERKRKGKPRNRYVANPLGVFSDRPARHLLLLLRERAALLHKIMASKKGSDGDVQSPDV